MSGVIHRFHRADHFPPESLPGLSRQSRVACSRGDFERFECCSRQGECVSTSFAAANRLAHHERMSVSPLDARHKAGHDVVVGAGHDARIARHDAVKGGTGTAGSVLMTGDRRASAAKGMVA